MFTGLVEEVGKVKDVIKREKSASLIIEAKSVLEGTKTGDSIAVNGVCLTVTELDLNFFAADVMTETFVRTNLKNLRPNDYVNLERALRLCDRLGGHIVSGHVDGTGIIKGFEREDIAVWTTIKASADILKYIVYKGSVTIDGISLTVAYVDDDVFKVSVIPHTMAKTSLIHKKAGDNVNIECDIIGKYVEKFLNNKSKKGIDMDFLRENGFL